MNTRSFLLMALIIAICAVAAFSGTKNAAIMNPPTIDGVTQGEFMDWSCYEGFYPVEPNNADPCDTLWWTGNIEYHISGGESVSWSPDLPQMDGVILKMKYGLWNSPSVGLAVSVNGNYIGTCQATQGYISPGPRYAQINISNYIIAGPDLIEVTASYGGEAVIGYVGAGVRSIDKGLAGSGEGDNLPLVFSLSSPTPNPFNPTTEIAFTLPEARSVELKVYDITGRTAAVLAEGNLQQGAYSYTWNANSFASGVYFVQLIAGGDIAVEKIILLK